ASRSRATALGLAAREGRIERTPGTVDRVLQGSNAVAENSDLGPSCGRSISESRQEAIEWNGQSEGHVHEGLESDGLLAALDVDDAGSPEPDGLRERLLRHVGCYPFVSDVPAHQHVEVIHPSSPRSDT